MHKSPSTGRHSLPGLYRPHADVNNSTAVEREARRGHAPVQQQSNVLQPNAQPFGPDLSALDGISPERLAQIAILFQSGALPLPVNPLNSQPAVEIPAESERSRGLSNVALVEDVEWEDGEIDEPSTPEAVPLASQTILKDRKETRHQDGLRNGRDGQFYMRSDHEPHVALDLADSGKAAYSFSQKQAQAKDFISLLHSQGYGYEQVAAFVKNTDFLRRVYSELGLPIQPANLDVAGTRAETSVGTGSGTVQGKVMNSAATNNVEKPVQKDTVKLATSIDRSAYLAKLAAAKSKKVEPAKSPATPSLGLRPAPSSDQNKQATANTKGTTASPAPKSAAKTELARQRLEAFRASQAAKSGKSTPAADRLPPTNSEGAPHVSASRFESSTLEQEPSELLPQAISTGEEFQITSTPDVKASTTVADSASSILSPTPPFSSGASGAAYRLPGLFMDPLRENPSSQPPMPADASAAAVSPAPVDDTPIRTATSDGQQINDVGKKLSGATQLNKKRSLSETSKSGSATPVKRPFGQSRHNSSHEQLIIHLSEDEDGDEEIEIEEKSRQDDEQWSAQRAEASVDTPDGRPYSVQMTEDSPSMSEYEKKMNEIAAFRRRIEKREQRLLRAAQAIRSKTSQISSTAQSENTTPSQQMSEYDNIPGSDAKPSTSSQVNDETLQEQPTAAFAPDEQNAIQPRIDTTTNQDDQSRVPEPSLPPMTFAGESAPSLTASEGAAPSATTKLGVDLVDEVQSSAGVATETQDENGDTSSDEMDTGSEDDSSDEESNSESDAEGMVPEIGTLPESSAASHVGSNVADGTSSMLLASQSQSQSEDESVSEDESSDESASNDSAYKPPLHHTLPERPPRLADEDVSTQKVGIEPMRTVGPDLAPKHGEAAQAKRAFSAYESPLLRFKDYRYHPNYLETVSGGLKSLTFSHHLEPDDILCPYELTGGRCNDRTCAYRHLQSVALSDLATEQEPSTRSANTVFRLDNELLTHLTTHGIPIRNPADEQRWREGLSSLLSELRTKTEGKDPASVANLIVQFRREFVGDPTKTLNLE